MKNEHGNVLFLILIAVALFAALSYAVTQSTRSGGGDASNEKSVTDVAVLQQQANAIRTAAIILTSARGVTADTLLFDPPAQFSSLTPAEIAREVFHPNGGGATYVQGWIVTSSFEVSGIGQSNLGNPLVTSDIVAVKEITLDLCHKVNEKMGIVIADAQMDAGFDLITTNFDDNMDHIHPGINGGGNGNWGILGNMGGPVPLGAYNDKPQGCFYNGASDIYLYYDVIIER